MDGVIVDEPGFLIGGGGGPNHMQRRHQTCNDVIKQFGNEKLSTGQRYRKMEDQKPWPGLARNHDFAEGGGIEVNLKSENV